MERITPPDADTWLGDAAKTLEPYDIIDLCSLIGGLQLAPENASHVFSLESAAAACTELEVKTGKHRISIGRLRQMLNEPGGSLRYFAASDDPPESPFVLEVALGSGSYRVFGGSHGESIYVLETLLGAISDLGGDRRYNRFSQRSLQLSRATLAVSEEMCKKAGLRRSQSPISSENDHIQIPQSSRLAKFKEAVTFRSDDLKDLVKRHGAEVGDMAPLVGSYSDRYHRSTSENGQPIPHYPFIQRDEVFIVVAPASVASRLIRALRVLVDDEGCAKRLAEAFRGRVFRSIVESLHRMGCDLVKDPQFTESREAMITGAFLGLDRDKAIHVLLVTDKLGGQDTMSKIGAWEVEKDSLLLRTMMDSAEAFAFETQPYLRTILHLGIAQDAGRSFRISEKSNEISERSKRLWMTASDLRTISFLAAGNQLRLLQFAIASETLHRSASVHQWSILDEYHLWKENDYCFQFGDSPSFQSIAILPGGGGELRSKLQERFDFRYVFDPGVGSRVAVARLDGDVGIPIYVPFEDYSSVQKLFVDLGVGEVWIEVSADTNETRYTQVCAKIGEMIAYWLWQCDPELVSLGISRSEESQPLVISATVDSGDAWFSGEAPIDNREPLSVKRVGEFAISISFRPSITGTLMRGDNEGERLILRELLSSIARLSANPLSQLGSEGLDSEMTRIVDRIAPLGIKKKLYFLSSQADPRLDDRHLPDYRIVQEADEELVRTSIARFLSNDLKMNPGPVEKSNRVKLLKDVVKFLFEELREAVVKLSPTSLLEALISLNEAIINVQARTELAIAPELACYGGLPDKIEELSRKLPEASQVVSANRVVIEYVTAANPRGSQVLSLATYDRLIALIAQIQALGIRSQMMHLSLADPSISISTSGRLELHADELSTGFEAVSQDLAVSQVNKSRRRFVSYWDSSSGEGVAEVEDELDRATLAEFGISLSTLTEFIFGVYRLGEKIGRASKRMELEQFRMSLESELGWAQESVDECLRYFSLGVRKGFEFPPDGFDEKDVYPWNLSRRLSYVRKPLLVRESLSGDPEVLWGNRNLIATLLLLLELCKDGRLLPRSNLMRRYIGKAKRQAAQLFNDDVAAAFAEDANCIVKSRVRKIKRQRLERAPGQQIGDIDVMVVDKRNRTVLVVETKDLALARTPTELKNEIDELFGTNKTSPNGEDRHLERVKWVKKRVPDVLEWVGLQQESRARWKVKSLIVLGVPSLGARIASNRSKIITMDQLQVVELREQALR